MFELRPYRKNNNYLSYNPFREMADLERAFFGDSFNRFLKNYNISEFKTDITDNGDSYLLEADMPGFDKKDINLEINGDTLIISAERRCENETKDQNSKYVCCERSYGKYMREFDISAVDADNISANYDNGVLKLVLPKKKETCSQSRRLEIQ